MKKFFIIVLCLFLFAGCSSNKSTEGSDRVSLEDSGTNYNAVPSKANYQQGNPTEEKYVYTGSVSFETTDYDKFIEEFNSVLFTNNGITQSYEERGSQGKNSARTMYLTVRVPAANFDKFLEGLRGTGGSIVSISTQCDNITKQYNSNDIKIEALETQHSRLLELMTTAGSLEDIIKLESRISEIEMELAELYNYKNSMDADVAYSTIRVQISEVVTYTEQSSFWQRVKNAVSGSLRQFVNGVEGFVIDVIYAMPALIVLAIAFLVLRKPVKTFIGKILEKKKAVKKPAEGEAN